MAPVTGAQNIKVNIGIYKWTPKFRWLSLEIKTWRVAGGAGQERGRRAALPGCLLYTRTGSAPHLTHDTLQTVGGPPALSCLPAGRSEPPPRCLGRCNSWRPREIHSIVIA
uniref:Uncharacterized protein n=1 Tax=Strigops habroptila TaxID=2489341 RepID=A0A672TV98_STRHB